MLEAKSDPLNEPLASDSELCFVWSSSRPDIVSITPIYEQNSYQKNECTRKALVTAVSKHAQRLTSIILAKETSKH